MFAHFPAAQGRARCERRWNYPTRKRLPSACSPRSTLIAVGRQDPWRSVEHHEDIASAIPRARLVVIDDCGHMAPAEQPRVVSELLGEWLRWDQ